LFYLAPLRKRNRSHIERSAGRCPGPRMGHRQVRALALRAGQRVKAAVSAGSQCRRKLGKISGATRSVGCR